MLPTAHTNAIRGKISQGSGGRGRRSHEAEWAQSQGQCVLDWVTWAGWLWGNINAFLQGTHGQK